MTWPILLSGRGADDALRSAADVFAGDALAVAVGFAFVLVVMGGLLLPEQHPRLT